MSFPDFSLITFVPPGKHANPPKPGEKLDLYTFFDAIVNKHVLEVDQYQLDEIFLQDLSIDIKKHDKILVGVLAEALIYFMTLWPGWEKSNDYYTGKIQCRDWFEKFKNYLIIKTTHIVNNAPKYNKKDKSKNRLAEAQVDMLDRNGGKRVAPYVLCVGGTPNILNNVVFVETNGHIFIKQHADKEWPKIQMKELINWPYVILEVNLPDISIRRANTHQMPRYLALCSDTTVFPKVEFIQHIKKLPEFEQTTPQPYSYDFFSSYLEQLQETLKLIPGVHEERLLELETIFTEFLLDIKEVDICNSTMCPYISVAFHIGKRKYIRNKKVTASAGRSAEEGINFYEMVIPEVDFSLNYFKAVQDDTDNQNVTFVSLNELKNNIKNNLKYAEVEDLKNLINLNAILYKCSLCVENFSGQYAYNNLIQHFQTVHKCEQTLLCHKCRKPFEVQALASNRWHHKCPH